jgi:hypothetical protein
MTTVLTSEVGTTFASFNEVFVFKSYIFLNCATSDQVTFLEYEELQCDNHAKCFVFMTSTDDIIGYLTFNKSYVFSSFSILAMATCFSISIPSSDQFCKCLPTIREPNN